MKKKKTGQMRGGRRTIELTGGLIWKWVAKKDAKKGEKHNKNVRGWGRAFEGQ